MTKLDLTSFLSLKPGWDTYRAKPITGAAIKTAEALRAVPVAHGGVQIEMHAGGMDIEIEIHPDGHVESVFCSRG